MRSIFCRYNGKDELALKSFQYIIKSIINFDVCYQHVKAFGLTEIKLLGVKRKKIAVMELFLSQMNRQYVIYINILALV